MIRTLLTFSLGVAAAVFVSHAQHERRTQRLVDSYEDLLDEYADVITEQAIKLDTAEEIITPLCATDWPEYLEEK